MKIYVFCADPRPRLKEKIRAKLVKPGEISVFLSTFGGPVCLVYDQLWTKAQVVIKDIRFAIEHASLFGADDSEEIEVILIGHDCGYYFEEMGMNVDEPQKKCDISKAVKRLQERFSGDYEFPVSVSGKYDESKGDDIVFKEVTDIALAV